MPVLFSEICVLLQRHEDVHQRQPPILNRIEKETQLRNVTKSWFKSHRLAISQLGVDSSVALLSTLLPERRTDRVYNTKSSRLVHILSRCLGLGASRTKDLHAYSKPGRGDLGQALERVLTNGGPPARPPVILDEVDEMLHILAGGCQFSDPAVQRFPPGSSEARDISIGNILKRLYPQEAKWFVRLVLKDFSPVRLNEDDILKGYHFLLPGVLRFQNRFGDAVHLLKGSLSEYPNHPDPRSERLHFQSAGKQLQPTVGVKVGRPNFYKARSINHCTRMLGGAQWVLERKYDGEYCEIHIDLTKSANPAECITIFSKSGKNSTADRQALHSTLLNTLRLVKADCKIKRQAILLGEMVVYSDQERCILPFDNIRKHVLRSGRAIGTGADSFPRAGEHLAIVFFDLLLLDDEVVMSRPIEERRQWLRQIYRKIDGRAMGAEWKIVDFSAESASRRILMQQFAASIAQRREGLVLKPCGVPYFSLEANPTSHSHSYIKLKKDYMQDMGDEADLAIVGGSYNAQQAANCGIVGIKWTEFHLGCLMNKADVLRFDARPRFKVVGSIQQEHCIPRPTLQAANALGTFCAAPHGPGTPSANFDLDLMPGTKIDTIFNIPFVFEVLGSGFEKPSNCNFYRLRHGRVKKLHEDRTWKDAVSLQELQEQAAAARSAAADSETQEARRWLVKLERKSRRKFERERTRTPKSGATGTSTTTVWSTGRTRLEKTSVVVREASRRTAASPRETSELESTTSINSTLAKKKPRNEASQTPCPAAKRQRTDKVSHQPHSTAPPAPPLTDITNLAPTPPATSKTDNTSFLKLLPALFKPSSFTDKAGTATTREDHAAASAWSCSGPSCPLQNTTIHLSPCIAQTPYITSDLLGSHLKTGCCVMTSKLKHWERDASNHQALGEVVSESPAWKGRRKVLLVEGRRVEGTRRVVDTVLRLGDGKALGRGEGVDIWDWRALESCAGSREGKAGWFLGRVEQDEGGGNGRLTVAVEWLKDSLG